MLIKRCSPVTGKVNERELPVTQEQLDMYYRGKLLIQRAFPELSDADREFIKTGLTPEDWSTVFPPDSADGSGG